MGHHYAKHLWNGLSPSETESTILGQFLPETGPHGQARTDLNRNQRKNASSRFSTRKYVRAVLLMHTHTPSSGSETRDHDTDFSLGTDGRKRRTEGIKKKVGFERKRPRNQVSLTRRKMPTYLIICKSAFFQRYSFLHCFCVTFFAALCTNCCPVFRLHDDPDYYDGEKKSTDYLAAGCSKDRAEPKIRSWGTNH